MTDKKSKDRSRTPEKDAKTNALSLPTLSAPSVFEDLMTKPFDELVGTFFSQSFGPLWTEQRAKQPNIDVQDRGDHLSLTVELPGFEKDEVEVRVNSNFVELAAEKRSEGKVKGTEGRQSSYAYFHRYLTLPERIVSEKASGTMKNGILELKLPKSEPKPKETGRKVRLN